MIEDRIRAMEKLELKIPDFPKNLEWFNSKPLSFQKELAGKLVVLDFWTYCCINCMHVLPDLAYLEKRFAKDPVVFIGVHSAKFDNEKDSQNIRQAVLRYDIQHPVVNDAEMTLWRRLGVHSWPTLALVSPTGNLLFSLSGEGQRETLEALISASLSFYPKNVFNHSSLPIQLEKEKITRPFTLNFPGKLASDHTQKRLFISDSNHHRIIVTNEDGKVLDTIGKGFPGLVDGDFATAQFSRLQGLAYFNNVLYVADSENHALRRVDLLTKTVSTLAGDGTQGRDYQGGKTGSQQQLSTPWDITITPDGQHLYIAMAGTHQIWKHDVHTGRTYAFSGSGAELNLNSKQLHKAAWAQPSGLSLAKDTLYIADSESSSLRSIDLNKPATYTLAGGDPQNPQNLFCFGDSDGPAEKTRLQHILGVLWLENEQLVLIADTYNHRIKSYNPATKQVVTIAGNGRPGCQDGVGTAAQFSEPSGLALSSDKTKVFIADTNNHQIRILDLARSRISTLKIHK